MLSLLNIPAYIIESRTTVMMNTGIKLNKATSRDWFKVFIAQ